MNRTIYNLIKTLTKKQVIFDDDLLKTKENENKKDVLDYVLKNL